MNKDLHQAAQNRAAVSDVKNETGATCSQEADHSDNYMSIDDVFRPGGKQKLVANLLKNGMLVIGR